MKSSTSKPPENNSDIIANFIIKCQENMAANGLPCDKDLILDGVIQFVCVTKEQKKYKVKKNNTNITLNLIDFLGVTPFWNRI